MAEERTSANGNIGRSVQNIAWVQNPVGEVLPVDQVGKRLEGAGIPNANGLGQTFPKEEAEQVVRLVQQAAFYGLPSVIRSTAPGADRFQYQITLDSERGAHSVQVDEGAVPPQLQPLLEWLKHSAR